MHPFGEYSQEYGGIRTRPLYDINGEDDDNGKLVVVIDDSHLICRIVEFSLREYAINTVSFYSGIDAINALRNGTIPIPDLVLLDINMPDMNGYNVASLLKSNKALRETLPIVMLSGRDGIFDRIRARRVGAEDFISKPFHKPELVRKIFPLLGLDLPDNMKDPQD
jgi:twitching motility two-component system response regulator PilG